MIGLLRSVNGDEAVAVWDVVLISAYRILTQPAVIRGSNTAERALTFLDEVREASLVIGPGDRYWSIFCNLIRDARATGNLVTDASIAALAIENGCRLATFDRDFARFKNLSCFEPGVT
ncbi:MAG TPA: PIN domain-containing protein [Fimbriimonadaceae bacterium]